MYRGSKLFLNSGLELSNSGLSSLAIPASTPFFDMSASLLSKSAPMSAAPLNGVLSMNGDDFTSDIMTTGLVTIDGAAVSGMIETSGDSDWFAFTANGGSTVGFNSTFTGPDLTFAFFDAAGNSVTSGIFSSSNSNQTSMVAFNAAESGTYYIQVSADGSQTGDYTLSAFDTGDTIAGDVSTTEVVTSGDAGVLNIDFAGDQDWFAVSLQAGEVLALQNTGSGFNNFDLVDASGTVLVSSLGFSTFTADNAATYYIAGVGDFTYDGPETYSFDVLITTDEQTADSTTTGVLVIDGSPVQGYIDTANDLDWYAIEVVAGQTVEFISSGELTLFDANGVQLQTNVLPPVSTDPDAQKADTGALAVNGAPFSYSFVDGGTYYIQQSRQFGATGEYTLGAVYTTDAYGADISTAGVLPLNEYSLWSEITDAADSDWFEVVIDTQEDILFFAEYIDNGAPLSLALYDSTGTEITAGVLTDAGPAGTELVAADLAIGTYYVGVSSTGASAYRVSAFDTEAIPNDDHPDTFADFDGTTLILDGTSVATGVIDDEQDVDVFAFTVDAGTYVSFAIDADFTFLLSGPFDFPVLSFTNSDGIFPLDAASSTLDGIDVYLEDAGTYYLFIDPNASDVGNYSITGSIITDDIAADQTTIGALTTTGTTVASQIDFAFDDDWFEVNLTAGETTYFSLNVDRPLFALDGDPLIGDFDNAFTRLELYDAAGAAVAPDAQGQGYTVDVTGTYYLAVEGAGFPVFGGPIDPGGPGGLFNRDVDTFVKTTENLGEPGDLGFQAYDIAAQVATDDYLNSVATTGVLTLDGAPVAGSVDFRFDQDWFELVVTEAGFVNITWTGEFESGFIEVFNSDGLFGMYQTGRAGNTLSLTADPGTYYIQFSDFSGVTGAYSLEAEFVVDDAGIYVNSDARFSSDGTVTNGALDYVGDADSWGVELNAGEFLQFDVSSLEEDLSVSVIDADGDYVFFGTVGEYVFEAVQAGLYFVEINAVGNRLDAVPTEYTISATLTSGLVDDIGGTIATAEILQRDGAPITTTISYAGDEDVFSLQLNAGETVTLNAAGTSFFDGEITLFDAAGNEIGYDDDSGTGSDANLDYTASIDETIYVQITATDEGEVGQYTLTATGLVNAVNVITGTENDDQLVGTASADEISGLAGNDALEGGDGDDTIDGGDGADTAVFSGSLFDYGVIGTGGVTGVTTVADNVGNGGVDTLTNIERIEFAEGVFSPIFGTDSNDDLGSSGRDLIYLYAGDDKVNASNGDDYIFGGDGADQIIGGDGADFIDGGEGNDLAYGGADNDIVNGDAGDDNLYGGSGDDEVNGGVGNDRLVGQSGNDTLNGGDGVDILLGGADDDVLSGGSGADTLFAQSGDDTINGGDGADLITGRYGDDTIDGGADNDNIFAGFGEDTVYGGAGDDVIRGEGQADLLYGGDGNDTITGGTGRDEMHGDAGDDTMFGQGGLDTMFGGDGNDSLYGGESNDVMSGDAGDDLLFGQNGNDTLSGGTGVDILNGGAGSDTFVFEAGFERDSVNGFVNDQDTLLISDFGFGTVEALLDPANGYVTQVDANTVRFDFGNGDIFTINSGSDFTIADLMDDILIA